MYWSTIWNSSSGSVFECMTFWTTTRGEKSAMRNAGHTAVQLPQLMHEWK